QQLDRLIAKSQGARLGEHLFAILFDRRGDEPETDRDEVRFGPCCCERRDPAPLAAAEEAGTTEAAACHRAPMSERGRRIGREQLEVLRVLAFGSASAALVIHEYGDALSGERVGIRRIERRRALRSMHHDDEWPFAIRSTRGFDQSSYELR